MCIRDSNSCGDGTSPGCCGSEAVRNGGALISEIACCLSWTVGEILKTKVWIGGFGLVCTRQSKRR